MADRSRRKAILVYREFQVKMVVTYLILLLIGLVFSSGLFLAIIRLRGGEGAVSWGTLLLPLVYTNLFSALLVSLLAVYLTALFSHRIAGPLFRFTRILEQVGEGDLVIDTQLRRHDELVQFARALGAMAEKLRARLGKCKMALAEVEVAMGTHPTPELKQSVLKLRETLDGFRI